MPVPVDDNIYEMSVKTGWDYLGYAWLKSSNAILRPSSPKDHSELQLAFIGTGQVRARGGGTGGTACTKSASELRFNILDLTNELDD